MGFASPAWLIGLLLVPVIWYLHRSGPILRRQPVSSIDLWRDSRPAATEAGARRRADPAWLRRAAIAALLSLALAGPELPRPAERVTLWVDDSLSMQTVESGETRLERGLREAATALGVAATGDAEVRTLGQPWRALTTLDATTQGSILSQAGRLEPQLPDATYLDRSRSHWLVTDGADARVNAWLAGSPVSRVFQVAGSSRNVGLSALSVRPQPSDARDLAVQLQLVNGGTVRETRRVEVTTGTATLAEREVSIEPGAAATLTIATRLSPGTLTARLSPADALAMDDVASVNTAQLDPVTVVVDPACPAALRGAVGAHPALRFADDATARLVIDCGSALEINRAAPRVRLLDGRIQAVDASTLIWAPGPLRSAPQRPASVPTSTRGELDAPRASDVVLAESGRPLIVLRSGSPRVVETSLDLSSPEFAREEALPLLVGFLVDTALGEPLLDRSVDAGRGETASQVAALRTLEARARRSTDVQSTDSAVYLTLLLIALALLAWDASLLGRRLMRDYVRPARASP